MYLCDADVFADVLRQVDHVSLLCHHHDEAGQSLRVESIHWIFLLLLLFRLFLIPFLTWSKTQPGDVYIRQVETWISFSLKSLFLCNISGRQFTCDTFELHNFPLIGRVDSIFYFTIFFNKLSKINLSCPLMNHLAVSRSTSTSWCNFHFCCLSNKNAGLSLLLLMSSLLCSHIWARCFSIKQPVMSDWFHYRNCH